LRVERVSFRRWTLRVAASNEGVMRLAVVPLFVSVALPRTFGRR
jgi:hypothetical protein